MDHASDSDPLIVRLREGLERIAFVLRADLWTLAGQSGLNPSRAQVLNLLASRPDGMRAKDVAAFLSVSAASMTDTLSALARKELVTREADLSNARAVRVRPTETGRILGERIAQSSTQVSEALATLSVSAQAELLLTQITLIRQLQRAGAIPLQRMCVSCRYFRPRTYPASAKLHHCAFIDAPIGDGDLRLDCMEHETADSDLQDANWETFAATSLASADRTVQPARSAP